MPLQKSMKDLSEDMKDLGRTFLLLRSDILRLFCNTYENDAFLFDDETKVVSIFFPKYSLQRY